MTRITSPVWKSCNHCILTSILSHAEEVLQSLSCICRIIVTAMCDSYRACACRGVGEGYRGSLFRVEISNFLEFCVGRALHTATQAWQHRREIHTGENRLFRDARVGSWLEAQHVIDPARWALERMSEGERTEGCRTLEIARGNYKGLRPSLFYGVTGKVAARAGNFQRALPAAYIVIFLL